SQVLSFRRLAHRVIQETGGAAQEPIDETGKKILLYRVLKQIEHELHMLQSSDVKKGWIDKCYSFITELRRYNITSREIKQLFSTMNENEEGLAAKLHDLHMIYERFEKQMSQGYID